MSLSFTASNSLTINMKISHENKIKQPVMAAAHNPPNAKPVWVAQSK